MTDVRYRPGRWFGIVTGTGCALLPESLGEAGVTGVHEAFEHGRGLAGVLEALTRVSGTSLLDLPPFAVVVVDGEQTRIAVRAGLVVEVSPADGSPAERVEGGVVTTWNERVLERPSSVSIEAVDASPPSPLSLPVLGGVVLASRITVTFSGPTLEAGAAPPVAAPPAAAPPAAAPPVVAPPPAVPAPVALPAFPPALRSDPPAAPVRSVPPPPSPLDTRLTWSITTASAGEDPEAEAGYDDLWARTRFLSVEDAAVRDRSEADGDDAAGEKAAGEAAAVPPLLSLPIPPHDVPAGGPPAHSLEPDDADHDGHTLSAAHLRALSAAHGRVESVPAPPAAPYPAASYPTVELSTGETAALDRPVVIGRKPEATRFAPGREPHLITVPSPQRDVSRSHVRLDYDGRHVVVRDLNTTNGTILHRRGQSPLRIDPASDLLLVGEDVLDLGDGITLIVKGAL